MTKIAMDVEKLVAWAYMDELSKRQSSAAEGIWDRIQENQHHGGIDNGHGAAQRYSHFGLPDPDAEIIERAVATLGEMVIDWNASFTAIAGDLAGLVSVNDVSPRYDRGRSPNVGWGEAGAKALNAWFGQKGARPLQNDGPRDVLMVGGIKTSVLVTAHAIKGTRPDWWDEAPTPQMTLPKTGGSSPSIVGECKGKNLYSTGSCCPLRWTPSPASIVASRAEYAAWHSGLVRLAATLELRKFVALPPKAPAAPWSVDDENRSHIVPVIPTGTNSVAAWGTLPLKPARGKMRAPDRRPLAGPVRYPLEDAV